MCADSFQKEFAESQENNVHYRRGGRLRILPMLVAVAALGTGLAAAGDAIPMAATPSLSAFHFGGGLDMRGDWKVRLSGMDLTVERVGKKSRKRRLSDAAARRLQSTVQANAFLDLRPRYGCSHCSDTPVCRLAVHDGQRIHEVAVFARESERDVPDVEESAELKRFFTVWRAVKGLAGLADREDWCR
jgi:hypothetical protein